MKLSPIQWTDYSGGSLNFVMRGQDDCAISAGCTNCYVKTWNTRWGGNRLPQYTTFDMAKLGDLVKIRFPRYSPRCKAPYRPMAFVCDMGDLFHHRIPDDFICKALDVMHRLQGVTWQVLTKRASRMRSLVTREYDNIWFGVTVENQSVAEERIKLLQEMPAAIKFLSIEPMLGPIDIAIYTPSWVICGGESGPNRRSFDASWAVGLYRQCKDKGIPFFYKQGSSLYPGKDDILPGYGYIKEWPK